MSTAAALISAALIAHETVQAVQAPQDLDRASRALSNYAETIARTPAEEQRLAMNSRDEDGQLVPTFMDALQAYFEAVQRAYVTAASA